MEAGAFLSLLLVALLDRCLTFRGDVSACLDARNHKTEPGPESSLYGHCSPWKDHACCTEKTAHDVHHKDMYSMSLDFCEAETGRKMSDACREHFRKDLCFYECEPNIGPWIVTVDRKIGKERFFEVPLCYSDCLRWWNDCKNDYACTPNWPRGFVFYGGVLRYGSDCKLIYAPCGTLRLFSGKTTAPKAATCVTFDKMYSGPEDFCNQVWDHSWNVVHDDKPCMHIWFNATNGNPNRVVAQYYQQKRKMEDGTQESSAASCTTSTWLLLLVAVFTMSSVSQGC